MDRLRDLLRMYAAKTRESGTEPCVDALFTGTDDSDLDAAVAQFPEADVRLLAMVLFCPETTPPLLYRQPATFFGISDKKNPK